MSQRSEMENDGLKSQRRFWTPEETRAFLIAYGNRRNEFEHTRKRKYVWQNVLEDLLSIGILTQPTTIDMLKAKLKNLLRAYKGAVDNSQQTGASGGSKVPFEEEMESIFGSRPEIQNSHTIYLAGDRANALPVAEFLGRSTAAPLGRGVSSITNVSASEDEFSTGETSTSLRISPLRQTNRRRMTCKEKCFRENMELRRKGIETRNALLEQYTRKKIEKMEEAEKKKDARFERKCALLKSIYEV